MTVVRKFGKLRPKPNAKTLKLGHYLTGALPPPPEKVYREYKIPEASWGMDANDTVGDCTCAAIAHMLMLMTAHTGSLITPSAQDVLSVYSAVTGYVPGNEETDNGAAISDVLNYWQTTGLLGHRILGWAQVDQTNIVEMKQAVALFSAIDVGVNLPDSAMQAFNNNQPWDQLDDQNIDGGHSIPIFGYGSAGATCVTWGQTQQMSWPWFQEYCDEAYAVISEDWIIQATQQTPGGLDLASLQADLSALKSE